RIIVPPVIDPGHVYHLFVVRSRERERFQEHLATAGIETLIHYPIAIPRQPALASQNPAECPVANEACEQVVSLPLHHRLSDADAECVIAAVNTFENGK
ncbi:MAG: DegT/DnrJ/EryC1/StrS family aminotransferase, partial [Acidimicrobiia bacterium]